MMDDISQKKFSMFSLRRSNNLLGVKKQNQQKNLQNDDLGEIDIDFHMNKKKRPQSSYFRSNHKVGSPKAFVRYREKE